MRKTRASKRKTKEVASLPSGYVGVYRGGIQWEAYIMEDDLIRLGTFRPVLEPEKSEKIEAATLFTSRSP